MLSSVWNDVRLAARALRRNPAYTVGVVATLALGIGATTSLFAVVHAAILRDLPYPDSRRLLSVSTSTQGRDREVAPQPWFLEWERSARTVEAIAAYMPSGATLTGRGDPIVLRGVGVTEGFFRTFGVQPLRGRTFSAEDFVGADESRAVILSHTLWREAFAADSSVVGTTLALDGFARTVVGVMPAEFEGPYAPQYWEPADMSPAMVSAGSYSVRSAFVVARARRGSPPDAVRAELTTLGRRAEDVVPAAHRDTTSSVVALTMHERLFGDTRRPLLVLTVAVVCLLLVACANVVNLSIARAIARQREFAIRTALGAGRWRLARIAITESVLLALAGGGVGLLIPVWTLPLVRRFRPESFANVTTLDVGGEVLAFCAVVALVTGMSVGLFPALAGARATALASLRGRGGRVTIGTGQRRVRHTLVVAEIAAAVALATGAGLLARSLVNVLSIDPGFRGAHTLAARISLPSARYANAPARVAFYETLAARAAAFPGVERVAYSAGTVPLRGYAPNYSFDDSTGRRVGYAVATVSHEYPATVGLILTRGRVFRESDRASAELPVIISESAARMVFASADPIGRPISAMYAPRVMPGSFGPVPPMGTVIGVVRDVAQGNFEGDPVGLVYRLIDHTTLSPAVLLVRATADPTPLMSSVRSMVRSLDAEQPVSAFSVLGEELAKATGPRRFGAGLVGAFAALAIALAATGLYGVMAYQLAQRTHEFGIRLALGAHAGRVRALIFREGMTLAAIGVACGVALAFGVVRTIRGFLFGVAPHDALTLVLAPFALLVVAALASYLPARRAARLSPLESLRSE